MKKGQYLLKLQETVEIAPLSRRNEALLEEARRGKDRVQETKELLTGSCYPSPMVVKKSENLSFS